MTRPLLVFARHGETDWNVASRLQGHTDIPLNGRGRRQAEALGRSLAAAFPAIGGMAFVASPLSRASETMRILRGSLGLRPDGFAVDDRLRELGFGRWEGSTLGEVRARDPRSIRARNADKWSFRPPGGESYVDLEARVGAFLNGLAGPAVVVAHGGVARAVLALISGAARGDVAEMRIAQGRALAFEAGGWRWV